MLDIRNLSVGYKTDRGVVHAVRDVNFAVRRGQIVGLVGESGCGKSTVLYAILGLIRPPGKIARGQILYNGNDLTAFGKEKWKRVRGKEISMIFQDPMTTLNPAFKIGSQIREVLHHHKMIWSPMIWPWQRNFARKLR